jgi:nucleoside-diphosphate-sugar epimerase
MKIFLTGGTGLLGSHFAQMAAAEGTRVVALVRPTSNTAYLDSLGGSVSCTTGDLLDVASLAAGMQGCDAVVHAASPVGGWGSPSMYEGVTVRGTRNVIAAMEATSVDTLVYISTISVHGLDPVQGRPISEADGFGSRFLPYDHYGRAKVEAEKAVAAAHSAGKIQATILRPGWIYGPRDKNSYGRLGDMMRRGIAIRVGKGDNRITLVYAGNVARAISAALARPSPACRVYLCANDGRITQKQYFESLARATQARRGPISLSKEVLLPLGALQEHLSILFGYRVPVLLSRYVVHLLGSDWSVDQSCIERELNYCPAITYQQGFAATEQWYRESRSLH